MKTVAIVGSHSRTRADVPWDSQDMDFWVFNESASIGWPKKVDAVFQMHAEPVWKNPLNRNDPKFPQWMKKEHPYPVWMLDVYEDVPASVSYPVEQISDRYLGKLRKGGRRVKFFTSSVAYAVALAIYEGYECIHLYGVEMESDTEYRLQRDGVFFWLGVAVGLGIRVEIPTRANMFSDPLYGYEGGAYLGREQLLMRKGLLVEKQQEAAAKLDRANAMQEEIVGKALAESDGTPGAAAAAHTEQYLMSVRAQTEALVEGGMFAGAIAEVDRYLLKCDKMDEESGDHMLARQEFELTAANSDKVAQKRKTHLDIVGSEARIAWKDLAEAVEAGDPEDTMTEKAQAYQDAHQAYLTAAFDFGVSQGVVQENIKLLSMVDDLIRAAGGEKAEEALLLERINGIMAGREVSLVEQA